MWGVQLSAAADIQAKTSRWGGGTILHGVYARARFCVRVHVCDVSVP